jgi:hypothetical protein
LTVVRIFTTESTARSDFDSSRPASTTGETKLPKFMETEMRLRDTSKPVTVNLDHLIQVTVGDEGRAVVHLSGGGSFSTDTLYTDFTARLAKAAEA